MPQALIILGMVLLVVLMAKYVNKNHPHKSADNENHFQNYG